MGGRISSWIFRKRLLSYDEVSPVFFEAHMKGFCKKSCYCRIGNLSECFILLNFSEWGQFSIMNVGCIILVIRILTFNIDFSE